MTLAVLPIHMWDRELDSRIFLSLLLLSQGASVVLGHEYNVSPLYRINKRIFTVRAGRPQFNSIRTCEWSEPTIENGGFVGLIYEEGINDITWKELSPIVGVNHRSLHCTSKLYSWCKKESDLFLESSPQPLRNLILSKTSIYSNSRIELCGDLGKSFYLNRAESIRKIFGDYVLISDNFALEGFGLGEAQVDQRKDLRERVSGPDELEEITRILQANIDIKHHSREQFADVVNELVLAFPQIMFIFRPHPIANPLYWHKRLAQERNLQIICHDSIEPWINGASCLIHAGCTVGLQASLGNIPSIDISKTFDDRRKSSVSTLISTLAPHSRNDLFQLLRQIFNNRVHADHSQKHQPNDFLVSTPSDEILMQNLNSLDASVFERVNALGIGLPNVSALLGVYSDYCEFIGSEPQSSNSIPITIDVKNYGPNKGKARHFSLGEIVNKAYDARKVLNLPIELSIKKLSCNTFYLTSA